MKDRPTAHTTLPQSGAALVVVLSLLVIVTVIVLAIAMSSLAERRAASIADHSMQTEVLAGLVENLVQTQLRTATTLPADRVWISQPGLIQTFNTNGTLNTAFKLYSGQSPRITDANELAAELGRYQNQTAMEADLARPAAFVDLNEPVHFQGTISYPILDPRALGMVEGFSYYGSSTPPAQETLPMPVQWMYVLEDGQIVAPDPTEGDGRRIPVPGAGPSNPIVGRIAYWTDDESCKLNINTAADGTHWDTPRAGNHHAGLNSFAEAHFGAFQPVRNEFQRYQGHPATTSLRPALAAYMVEADPALADRAALREALLELNPRYQTGGSLGGTANPQVALQIKDDAFYASTDEYHFDQSARSSRSQLPPDTLEQTRFFLTAHSRAPEVNLFNLPRVALWPIRAQTGVNFRTAFDNLILFCSTLGGLGPDGAVLPASNVYAFTRENNQDMEPDLQGGRNLVLYNYLNTLMNRPIPGFGSGGQTFATKYGADQPQILTQIVDYIRIINSADRSMPPGSAPGQQNPFQTFAPHGGMHHSGIGTILPLIKDPEDPDHFTMGFGRFPIMSEAVLIIMGEFTGTHYQARAAFTPEITVLAQGPMKIRPHLQVRVRGLENLEVSPLSDGNFVSMGFPTDDRTPSNTPPVLASYPGDAFGGPMGIFARWSRVNHPVSEENPVGYPFASAPFTFSEDPVEDFVEEDLTAEQIITSWHPQEGPPGAPPFTVRQTGPILVTFMERATGQVVQEYHLNFPEFSSHYPRVFGFQGDRNSVVNIRNSEQFPDLTLSKTMKGRLVDASMRYPETFPHNWDITRSLVPLGPMFPGGAPINGDMRLMAGSQIVPESVFVPNFGYFSGTSGGNTHSLMLFANNLGRMHQAGQFGSIVEGHTVSKQAAIPDIPYLDYEGELMDGVKNILGQPGDFDTGVSFYGCGPWINKADEGDEWGLATFTGQNLNLQSGLIAYFRNSETMHTGEARFSPNRQVASPVQLGSLPTGVKAGHPWQTLLFSPNPAAVTANAEVFSADVHPGFASPPDHLLLDLFWMPVVEPYAISDPFSTAGKVNLNHQIVPFSFIRRDTALRGVLANARISAIPLAHGFNYKFHIQNYLAGGNNYRYPINISQTINEIDARYETHGPYLSASEICEVFLIPEQITENSLFRNPIATNGLTGGNIIEDFWSLNTLTGDNLRERPYNAIYPRLTTKSNVFTVHYTVQTLQQVPGGDPSVWDEDRDQIVGEQRGSTTLERYIDPRDPEFDDSQYDFAARIQQANPPTLGRFYKFRTVATRQFRQ